MTSTISRIDTPSSEWPRHPPLAEHRQTLRTQHERFVSGLAESFRPSQQSLFLPACFQKIGETLKVRLSIEFAPPLSSSQCVHECVALYPGRTADNSRHVFVSRPELTDGVNAHATICTGKISAFCKADKCPPDRCEG